MSRVVASSAPSCDSCCTANPLSRRWKASIVPAASPSSRRTEEQEHEPPGDLRTGDQRSDHQFLLCADRAGAGSYLRRPKDRELCPWRALHAGWVCLLSRDQRARPAAAFRSSGRGGGIVRRGSCYRMAADPPDPYGEDRSTRRIRHHDHLRSVDLPPEFRQQHLRPLAAKAGAPDARPGRNRRTDHQW